jgi:hypothetical protein
MGFAAFNPSYGLPEGVESVRLYLDNCCFNRPFDDQSQLRIRLEVEAKLGVQEAVRNGTYQLVWSYILDYENGRNPFPERRERIASWRRYAGVDVEESAELLSLGRALAGDGLKTIDALHVACAIIGRSDYFLTTDDGILRKAAMVQTIRLTDPIGFVKEVGI